MIGSDAICQIGIVVHDIEKVGQAFADFLDMKRPNVVDSGPVEIAKAEYKGQSSNATCKMMFFELKNLQLELIQPDEHPSIWKDVLDEKGEGIHHVAFKVKGARDHMKNLAEKGYATTMSGNYGDASGMYAYLDTVGDLKMIVELLESF